MEQLQQQSAQEAILFDGVTFSYEGERDVLNDIGFSIEPGTYVAVLGHNGSGKSTMARCINALLVPDQGTVRVMGLDTADLDDQLEIRRSAGMVFQNPDNQMVTSIVADDVAFGPENLGIPQPQIVERVNEALAAVAMTDFADADPTELSGGQKQRVSIAGVLAMGIPQPQIVERVNEALAAVAMTDFADADPTELSGGQKQRVSIAGVLAMRPDILIFDEPCAMLDPRGRRGIRRVMRDLNDGGSTIVHITHFMEDALEADLVFVMDQGRMLDPRGRRGIRRVMRDLNDGGSTIVHITHFMEDALEADLVFVMDQGRIVLQGTPDEVFSHGELLRSLGLEQPFAMQLATRLRALGVDVPDTPHLERSLGLEQPFAMQLATRLRALGVDVPDTPHLEVLEEALCR